MQQSKHIRRIGVFFLALIILVTTWVVPVYGAYPYDEYLDLYPSDYCAVWVEIDVDDLNLTGSFLSLQLVCVEGDAALAIITMTCESMFFATSTNMTDWEIQSPAAEWYYFYEGYYYWYVDDLFRASHLREDIQYILTPYDECHEWDYYMSFICKTNESISQVPSLDLLEGGITRIERLPFYVGGEIVWVGFVIKGEVRSQLRILNKYQWINYIEIDAVPMLPGIEGFRWAHDAIQFVVARDLMDLYICPMTSEPILFDPASQATRGNVLAAAVKALGLIAPDIHPYYDDHIPFMDVPLWGRGEYIDIAKQLGLVAGIGNNQFAPDRIISRQDMMTMLYNIMLALGKIQPDYTLQSLGRFRDLGDIADYARLPIASLARAGIISGNGININPRGYMTRVEAAVFVWNLYRINNE